MTVRALEVMGVPYHVVIEEQELAAYAAVIPRERLLVLDPAYQEAYDPFDELGRTKSLGPGPARNFAWEHAVSQGHERHWVMDDNIRSFNRLNHNLKVRVADGAFFWVMEEFCLRYTNVAMAGPNYWMFAPRKTAVPPLTMNTRIYSCNLVRNSLPFRWRGRYNEDTDISLRALKAGWCTVLFNAFLQDKVRTQLTKGGNTAEFYANEGTLPKSLMQVRMHPDVSRLAWRFGRAHHYVDYSRFRQNRLVPRPGVVIPDGVENFGMELRYRDGDGRARPSREGDRGEGAGHDDAQPGHADQARGAPGG